MDAVTYPDPAVTEAVSSRFIAVHAPTGTPAARALAPRLLWLPTLIFLDRRGAEHYRSVNALAAPDLLDVLDIGEALVRLREAGYDAASALLAAVEIRRPDSPFAAEARYWAGVAAYFAGGRDRAALARIWAGLRADFPGSPWAAQALTFHYGPGGAGAIDG
jgi:hypothetical protein